MDTALTPLAETAVGEIAARHSLSREAVMAMLLAVRAGGGTMAQFSIPELGGSGQWMRGGMTMVGDMFDHSLKARVDALCEELAELMATTTVFPAATSQPISGFATASWWPAELGTPSSTGAQNDTRYAIFPGSRRLVIQIGGTTRIFDTGEHNIGGVQQQQGGAAGTVGFTSQFGTFSITTLRELGVKHVADAPAAAPAAPAQSAGTAQGPDAVVAAIEALANLHSRGILSDDEFAAKKTELLGRL
ncbi:SHOCT domain-containing protein [Mycobacterium sp. C31M]